jgi:chromosome segregation ATPase
MKQNDIKKCEQAIALGVRDVEDFEAKIRKKDNADQGNDPEVARLRDLIQQHQALTARLRRQRPKIEDDIINAETALARAEEAETIATNTRMAASQAEREQAQRIESLKAQSGNRLNAFGRRIDMVMSEIDRARWTASKPIGPLGLHVKLTDPRYKDAFHRYFGQILCQFAVRNDTDRRTMMDILKRCHAK